VRPARAEDVNYIRSLSRKLFHQYGPYENILALWFESDIAVTLLALMGKRPVGFALLGRLERKGYPPCVSELLAIAVEPAKWKLGVGDLLMREVLREAKELKVETLVLHTAVENLSGQKLFKKYGFTPLEVKKNFYPEGQDALMMYKDIS
jgi:ribosomal-protein-alanine N-acetyltransferase